MQVLWWITEVSRHGKTQLYDWPQPLTWNQLCALLTCDLVTPSWSHIRDSTAFSTPLIVLSGVSKKVDVERRSGVNQAICNGGGGIYSVCIPDLSPWWCWCNKVKCHYATTKSRKWIKQTSEEGKKLQCKAECVCGYHRVWDLVQ